MVSLTVAGVRHHDSFMIFGLLSMHIQVLISDFEIRLHQISPNLSHTV